MDRQKKSANHAGYLHGQAIEWAKQSCKDNPLPCKKCGEVVPCEDCLPGVRLEALRENLKHVDREGLLRMLLEAEDDR